MGDLLGDVIIGAVAIKMIDSAENSHNQNQQKRKKQTQSQSSQTTQHKKTSHSGRSLLQPKTDGNSPF